MNTEVVLLDGIKHGMTIGGNVALALMLPMLVVGLVIAVFQAATQINEASLSFIPKLGLLFITIMLAGDMLIEQILDYYIYIFKSIPSLVN